MEKRIVKYCKNVYDEKEYVALAEYVRGLTLGKELLTNGRHTKLAEEELADFLGVKHCLTVNSGSSANLIAFMALTSHKLEDRRIDKGDEVITVACAFPTTIAPIVNYGAIPVFVDVDWGTANIKVEELDKALSDRTKAVFIAHTLGNPFDIDAVVEFCAKNDLFLIEDNCDSLGSTYKGKYTGTFGTIGTSSFFPAHHISCGQGGAVYTDDSEIYMLMKSFRDWGRDYKCIECKRDCKKRFEDGQDCRYSYSHFGFNCEITEMQAVLLREQIQKIESFTVKRQKNWNLLYNRLNKYNEYFSIQEPLPGTNPSWFSFLMTIRDSRIQRKDFQQYLEDHGIETRILFAGNILDHKCMKNLEEFWDYRVVGNLENSIYIKDNSFFIGCYPEITVEDINYVGDTIDNFLRNY